MVDEARTGWYGFFTSFSEVRTIERCTKLQLKLSEHYVMDKKTKVRFDTASHCLGGLLDCVHVGVWGPTKTASLRGHRYCLFC